MLNSWAGLKKTWRCRNIQHVYCRQKDLDMKDANTNHFPEFNLRDKLQLIVGKRGRKLQ